METDLFCIHHGKMVRASKDYAGRLFHYETVQIGGDRDPGNRFDVQECMFPDGVAACPPPNFDLEAYVAENGKPPEILEEPEELDDYQFEKMLKTQGVLEL